MRGLAGKAKPLFHAIDRLPPLLVGQPLVRRQTDMPVKERLAAAADLRRP